MPKVPVDYSQTCIYKLVHFDDLNDNNIYVGHTTNMTKRKARHKNACINPNDKEHFYRKYKYIRDNGGWDKWEMILIEKYPCKDEQEALARERYWKRELNATLNTQEPGRTKKEYYEDNKEQLAEKHKEYYKDNRDEIRSKYKDLYKENIAEKYKEKITCECGCIVRKREINRHRKTNKHEKFMKNNNLTNN